MRDAGTATWTLFSYFTRHSTMANLLMVLMIAAGLWAMQNMRVQFFPDDVRDSIRVSATLPNASAEDVDSSIMIVLEPALRAVDGVESTTATSREGGGTVFLQFVNDYDMQQGQADVSEVLQSLTGLPADAEVQQNFSSFLSRVADVVISSPVGVEQVAGYADELVARLFAEGVTRTTIRGVAAPGTIVEVPTANLIAFDVTMAEIAQAIGAEVNADSAGDVAGAGARVRTGVEKRSAAEIAGITLRSYSDGRKLVVGDIATIRVEGPDRVQAFYVEDNPAVTVRVDRSAAGDIIEIQNTVQRVADDLVVTLPSGSVIELTRTRAAAIENRIGLLVSNGAMGLVLVLVLLFLFLNWRTAFWVAMGIPTAMLAAVALMYVAGLTFNMISLFALIITLGIVVDDAIVVGEHADARARMGEGPYTAAENAAARMSRPVFSATITTIIAFFGLTVFSGGFGRFLADIPFTVIAVLAASLMECFLILPHHMATALKHRHVSSWADAPSSFVNKWFIVFRERYFRPAMGYAITGRYVVLAFAVLLLSWQFFQLSTGNVSWRFWVPPDRPSISGNFAMVPDAGRQDSLEMMRELQRAANAVGAQFEQEYGVNPVIHVMGQIGGLSGRGLSGAETKTPDQLGAISIELLDRDLRVAPGVDKDPYPTSDFTRALQTEYRRHPLQETVSFRFWRSGPGGDSLHVQFSGNTTETLKAAAEELKSRLSRVEGVTALEDTLAYDNEELVLELTPNGQALGFTIDQLGAVLRNRIAGIEAATYPVGTRTATVTVSLPDGELTADFLERMQLRNPEGTYVQLADIVSVVSQPSFASIRRENGVRLVSVTGEIDGEDAELANAVNRRLESEILPAIASQYQVNWDVSGLNEEESAFLSDALLALILVLVGIYLTLSWVFASWSRPIVVMAVIPFGLVGAVIGHWVMDTPMTMFSIVGLLGMTGIIINDSIVLVTQIDGYTKDRGIIPSIIAGTSDRLRAVLLTTLTTVLGLTPLLFEPSSDAQFLKPTVITLVFGLGFGMFLVLLVVPALMAIQSDVGQLMRQSMVNLRFRQRQVRQISGWGLAAMVMWLGPTLGHALLWGAPHPLLQFGRGPFERPEAAAISLYFTGLLVIIAALAIANLLWLRSLGPGGRLPPLDSSGAPRPPRRPRDPAPDPMPALVPAGAGAAAVAGGGLLAASGGFSQAMGRAGSALGGLLPSRMTRAEEEARRMPPMPDPEGTAAFDDPRADPVDGRLLVEQAVGPQDATPAPPQPEAEAPVDPVPPPAIDLAPEPVEPEPASSPAPDSPLDHAQDQEMPSVPPNDPTDRPPLASDPLTGPRPAVLRGQDVLQRQARSVAPPPAPPAPPEPDKSHRAFGFGWMVNAFNALRSRAGAGSEAITPGELEREHGTALGPDGTVRDPSPALRMPGPGPGGLAAPAPQTPLTADPVPAPTAARRDPPARSALEDAIGAALAGDTPDRAVLDAAERVVDLPGDRDVPFLAQRPPEAPVMGTPVPPQDAVTPPMPPADPVPSQVIPDPAPSPPVAAEPIPPAEPVTGPPPPPPEVIMPPVATPVEEPPVAQPEPVVDTTPQAEAADPARVATEPAPAEPQDTPPAPRARAARARPARGAGAVSFFGARKASTPRRTKTPPPADTTSDTPPDVTAPAPVDPTPPIQSEVAEGAPLTEVSAPEVTEPPAHVAEVPTQWTQPTPDVAPVAEDTASPAPQPVAVDVPEQAATPAAFVETQPTPDVAPVAEDTAPPVQQPVADDAPELAATPVVPVEAPAIQDVMEEGVASPESASQNAAPTPEPAVMQEDPFTPPPVVDGADDGLESPYVPVEEAPAPRTEEPPAEVAFVDEAALAPPPVAPAPTLPEAPSPAVPETIPSAPEIAPTTVAPAPAAPEFEPPTVEMTPPALSEPQAPLEPTPVAQPDIPQQPVQRSPVDTALDEAERFASAERPESPFFTSPEAETQPMAPPAAPVPTSTMGLDPAPAVRRMSMAERMKSARIVPPPTAAVPQPPAAPMAPPAASQPQPPVAPPPVAQPQPAAPSPQQTPSQRAQVNPSLSQEMLDLALEMEQEVAPPPAPEPEPAPQPAPPAQPGSVSLSMTDTFSAFMGPSGESIQPMGRLAKRRTTPPQDED